MKNKSFLISTLLFLCINASAQTKPTLQETKDWILEKLNTYTISDKSISKSASSTISKKYDNYVFSFTSISLIISCTLTIQNSNDDGSVTGTTTLKYTIPLKNLKPIESGTFENGTKLIIETNGEVILLEKSKTVMKGSDGSERTTEAMTEKTDTFYCGFNLDGENNILERLKKAFTDLRGYYQKKEKEVY